MEMEKRLGINGWFKRLVWKNGRSVYCFAQKIQNRAAVIIGESMMVGKVLVVYQAINSCLDIMTVIPDGHHKPLNALHTYTLFTIHNSQRQILFWSKRSQSLVQRLSIIPFRIMELHFPEIITSVT